jgi:hypothetical protein
MALGRAIHVLKVIDRILQRYILTGEGKCDGDRENLLGRDHVNSPILGERTIGEEACPGIEING